MVKSEKTMTELTSKELKLLNKRIEYKNRITNACRMVPDYDNLPLERKKELYDEIKNCVKYHEN